MKLDRLDHDLMVELQKDGRQSYTHLADLLNVSEATVRNRVNRLLSHGIIKIKAAPNLQALGYKFIGVVGVEIRLSDLAQVAERLTKHPNVCYLISVTGRSDFIAIVVTRSPDEFADFVRNELSQIPGIVRTETSVSLSTYKGIWGNLDIEQLIADLPF